MLLGAGFVSFYSSSPVTYCGRGTNEEFGSPAFSHSPIAFRRRAILGRELYFETCGLECSVWDRGLCELGISIRVCELASLRAQGGGNAASVPVGS
jgi:hypothetical protein